MTETRWKFLRLRDGAIWSDSGQAMWEISRWKQTVGPLEMCWNGFHCSQHVLDAFGRVAGEVVGQVEVEGRSFREKDKEVWERARLISAWEWRIQDCYALVEHVAELALPLFASVYPHDQIARITWEAAKHYYEHRTGLLDAQLKQQSLIEFAFSRNHFIVRKAGCAVERATSIYCAFNKDPIRQDAWTAAEYLCQAMASAKAGPERMQPYEEEWQQAYRAACADFSQWMTTYIQEHCLALVSSH